MKNFRLKFLFSLVLAAAPQMAFSQMPGGTAWSNPENKVKSWSGSVEVSRNVSEGDEQNSTAEDVKITGDFSIADKSEMGAGSKIHVYWPQSGMTASPEQMAAAGRSWNAHVDYKKTFKGASGMGPPCTLITSANEMVKSGISLACGSNNLVLTLFLPVFKATVTSPNPECIGSAEMQEIRPGDQLTLEIPLNNAGHNYSGTRKLESGFTVKWNFHSMDTE